MVEVDAGTGAVTLLRYLVAHDCGKVINPVIVEGQIHGGVAQGVGGGLLEEMVYDEQGQLLTGTFMDYLVPTAMELPPIETVHLEYPSPRNPLGIKGIGEGGAISPPAAIANAVEDALAPFGGPRDADAARPVGGAGPARAEGGEARAVRLRGAGQPRRGGGGPGHRRRRRQGARGRPEPRPHAGPPPRAPGGARRHQPSARPRRPPRGRRHARDRRARPPARARALGRHPARRCSPRCSGTWPIRRSATAARWWATSSTPIPPPSCPRSSSAWTAWWSPAARGGERMIPADRFYRAPLTTSLAADELATAVRFTLPAAGAGWGFAEVARRHGDFALVGAVAVLARDGRRHRRPRAPRLLRRRAARRCAALPASRRSPGRRRPPRASPRRRGRRRPRSSPDGDLHATAAYRRQVAATLAERTLTAALARCGGTT